jgi:glycosyltransferase involved in cell wall biosynthesis
MNILLAIQNLEVGGAERQAVELACGLKKLEHKVTICCLNSLGPLAEEVTSRGVVVVCLGKKFKYDFTVIFRFFKLLKNNNIDVLQTFLFGADLWGRLAARLAGVKVLLTSNRSGGVHYENKELWFERVLWPLSDGIISNTNIGRELLHKNIKIPLSKTYFVPNGYDLNKFNGLPDKGSVKSELGFTNDQFVAVITGSLKPVKNHKMLIESARLIVEKNNKIVFMVIGGGVLELELLQMTKKYGLKDNIIFLGLRQDIPRLLQTADVGILTSKWEGMANSILEYMASGLPVVATDVGGVRDLITPDKTGYLVPSDDAPAMAQKLLELFNDPARAKAMGQTGKEWVQANCDFMQLARKTEAIYQEIYQSKVTLKKAGH